MTVQKGTILIVDDDRLNLRVLRAHLSSAGHDVWEASSGAEAMQRAKARPDLILLDIVMPIMNGFETCRCLKEDKDTCDIPVIFLSALEDPEYRVNGFSMGGVDYVTKPFNGPELLARVKTHLTLRFQEQEINRYARKLEQMVEERTQQLIHADRLATLGTFAAAIVHEINNPLTYIGGNAELLKFYWKNVETILEQHELDGEPGRAMEVSEKVNGLIEGILNGLHQIVQISNTLRAYGGKGESKLEPCLLTDSIDSAVGILHHRFKYGVTIDASSTVGVRVLCDRQKLSQVFMNLFTNAIDAMKDGIGHVSVKATQEGEWVHIEVADNGCGIPGELSKAIFDPFFTSKGEGHGTGLGLFIVRNIIEEHRGRIALLARDGAGAVFGIDLPAATGA